MEAVASAAVSGVTLASGKGDLLELLVRCLLLRFLPGWLQLTILGLVLTTVITVWAVRRTRASTARRAAVADADG
ncbi:hypothetical protein [Streptomyces sp. NPDC002853]